MQLKFKSDCPQCGGKNKITTKIFLGQNAYSKVKCYKCGWRTHGGKLDSGSLKTTFTPQPAA